MFQFLTLHQNSLTYSTKPPRLISPPLSIKPSPIFSLKKSLPPLNKIPKLNPSSSPVVFPLIKLSVKTLRNSKLNSTVLNVISHSLNSPAITPPWSPPPLTTKFYPASNLPTPISSISFPVPRLNSIFFPI